MANAVASDDWARTGAWANRWLRSLSNEKTRKMYELTFRGLLVFGQAIGVAPIAMNRHDIEAWVRELGDRGNRASERPSPLSANSIRRMMSTASSFYDYCIENDAMGTGGQEMVKNPVSKRQRPQAPVDSRQQYLEPSQIRALISEADRSSPDMAALIGLMLCCLRVSEAAAARVEDLSASGKHRVLRFRRKGGKVTNIPVPLPEGERLRAVIGGRKTGLIVRDEKGEPLSRIAIGGRLKTIARRAGIEGNVTPHTLRHAAITYALDQGAPLHVVQAWAGHSSPQTTAVYWRNKERLDGSPAYLVASGYYDAPEP